MNSNFIADLTGKTAIITGGAGLIGRVYASALLQSGSNVIILDKKIDKIKLTELIKKENNGAPINSENLKLIECDITNPQEIKRIFKKMKPYLSNLEILINNASLVKQVKNPSDLVSVYKPFLKMNPNDWEEYLSVDITGSLLTIQQVIPYMKKNNGGVIVNISSTYGILSPDQRLYAYFNKKLSKKEKKLGTTIEKPIGYSISKSGILNMTRFLATKFADDNIRVNTLTLGGVYADNPSPFVKEYSKRTQLGSMADKREYAGPLLFLVSDMSSYMTGSNLIVDGGWSAW